MPHAVDPALLGTPNIHSTPTLAQLSTDTVLRRPKNLLIILLLLAGVCGVDQGFLPIFQDPNDAFFDLLVCFLIVGHQHVIFQGTVLRLLFLFREAGIGVLELLVFFVEALTLGVLGNVGLPQAPVEVVTRTAVLVEDGGACWNVSFISTTSARSSSRAGVRELARHQKRA